MPKIEIQTPRIEIDIDDLVQDNTIIKRTAALFNMNYNQSAKELVLQWEVRHFSNVAGAKGEYMGGTGGLIPDWTKETIADNTTMCDTSNGHPLAAAIGAPNMDEAGYPVGMNYMGQYDFFYGLAGAQPIIVHPMIIQFGQLVQSWEKH